MTASLKSEINSPVSNIYTLNIDSCSYASKGKSIHFKRCTDFLMQASDEIDNKETLKQMIYVSNSTYILIS